MLRSLTLPVLYRWSTFNVSMAARTEVISNGKRRSGPLSIRLSGANSTRLCDRRLSIRAEAGRPAAARDVIADGERQHDEQPEYSRYDDHLRQARTPAHVHEDQHDSRRLDDGDGQRDESVEHAPDMLEHRDVCGKGLKVF